MSDKETVCVTGAGGYLASWLVKLLLSKGYMVHGTVRNPNDDKNAHLKKFEKATENMKLFKADLLDYEGLCGAIAGCSGVFHVASPLPRPNSGSSKEAILEPAVTGTRNVLKACSKAEVKKVVVVSSIAAIAFNPKWQNDRVMNEECWSDLEFCEAVENWYFLSKTVAETEAWEYAKRSDLNIITVCPSLIVGPMLQPTMNASSFFLLHLLQGGSEPVPNDTMAYVDVRDTAESLLLVYEKPEAEGRYICSSFEFTAKDMVDKLKSMYPDYNYPESFCEARMQWRGLSSRKLQDLGWKYKPLEETIVDTVKDYEERGAIVKELAK